MLIPTDVQLREITAAKAFPITYAYSRLEGRPRRDNFERALKAELRDALWMLSKQWQMGEFEGDDAGSPVTMKMRSTTALIDKYRPGEAAPLPFDRSVPFEALVERRPLPLATRELEISLDLRLVLGRRWMQGLRRSGLLNQTRTFFLDHYGIRAPRPEDRADAAICAHPEVWQQFAAVAGRLIDGARLLADLDKSGAEHYYNLPDFPGGLDKAALDTLEAGFRAWVTDLFFQPDDPASDAWDPSRLEYRFSISAPRGEQGEKVMHAQAYYQGHLDWYNLDLDAATPSLGALPGEPAPAAPEKTLQTLIPTPVTFEGMPNARWWAFEEGRTNFSYVKPDTTDLAKLALLDFGLVYANDWYLIPLKLPVGSLTRIDGLSLTNCFGEHFWIRPAGSGIDSDWRRWNAFSLKVDSPVPVPADTDLLLLPTVAKIQEGKPLEEVLLLRDEMANMVWGVESIVPLPGGGSKSGFEVADQYHALLQKLVTDAFGSPEPPPPVADGDEVAKIRYEVMNQVPENWIPFIPVHVEGSNREVQLQRAAMPRVLEGDPAKPLKIRPRTTLLQTGLAEKAPYYLHEEEVPRAGIRVAQSFQRTRWNDGRVFVWFGARKTTGRGEGSSGLGFDRIVNREGAAERPA